MQPNTLTLLCAVAIIAVVFIGTYSLKGLIVTTKDELAASLNLLADKADKAKTEIVSAVDSLKAEIANANVDSPAISAALARLDGSVQALDDLNPDAEPTPTEPV